MGIKISTRLYGLLMSIIVLLGSLQPCMTVQAAGTTFIVHYGGRSDNNYDGWNLWLWEEGKDGQQVSFTDEDSFGKIAIYQCKGDPAKIGFIVRLNEWEDKDVAEDRFAMVDSNVVEIWVSSGVSAFTTEPPEGGSTYDFASIEEERLNLYHNEDALKLNIHYYSYSETYDSDSLAAYAWLGEDAGGTYPYVDTDEYGAVFHVGLLPQDGLNTAGVKILVNDTADTSGERTLDLSKAASNVLDIYLVEGNPAVWYSAEEVDYSPVFADAYFRDTTSKQIIFTLSKPIDTSDETEADKFTVTDQDGEAYPILKIWSESPKVENTAYLIMDDYLDLSKTYTVTREGYKGIQVSLSKIIGSAYFDEAFAYDGEDLGAVYTSDSTRFRVWAPTASEVELNLYEQGDGDNLLETIPMQADVKGTWFIEKSGDLNGLYYTYSVTTGSGSNEVVDLYARSAGVNGNRGMILDLNSTDPEGFAEDTRPVFGSDTEAVIYELHVRDLSSDPSSGIQNTGKFLGLTEKGTTNSEGLSTGLDHIIDLGITHLHLLPVYDYATVDESVADSTQFNWGYDPKNYNIPEGSYSTDPYHGEVRVREMKEMVQTLHDNGVRVVMDVVYNHTFSTEESWFQQTVPDYYYRKDGESFSNASGCGNETASERAMMRKYMIDSVVYWATEYHIDGFRFDLMGIHDTETMILIREALDEVDPSIIIYGEGWTSGDSTLNSTYRATKAHTYQMPRIAAFSDDIRDSLKGNVFDSLDTGFISGKAGMEESIKFSVAGAVEHDQVDIEAHEKSENFWSGQPGQSINYVSCHDNLTLWDKLAISNENDSEEDRVRMNWLASAVVFTSQGIPFLQAGEEMLRSKPSQTVAGDFDENSYNSPDATNSIKWDQKSQVSDTYEYYKGLIAFRKVHGALRMTTAEEVQQNLRFLDTSYDNVVAYTITNSPNNEIAEELFIVYNANRDSVTIDLPEGDWNIYVDGEQAGVEVLGTANGTVSVDSISAMVLAKGLSAAENVTPENEAAGNEILTDKPGGFPVIPAVIICGILVVVITGVIVYRKKNN